MVKKVSPQAPTAVRTHLLQTANTYITKDRQADHGKAEDSFSTIAAYWSVYLTKETGISIQVTAQDVAVMMSLFKVARIHNNPGHSDNWIDLIGYAALGGEIALNNCAHGEAK